MQKDLSCILLIIKIGFLRRYLIFFEVFSDFACIYMYVM